MKDPESLEEYRRRLWACLPLIAKYAGKTKEEVHNCWAAIERKEMKDEARIQRSTMGMESVLKEG